MKQTLRTFVAVEMGSAVREAAGKLIEMLRGAQADVKWVETGNLHLTLKFLGEVPTPETPRICEAVKGAVAELTPFELEVRGAGAFPDSRRPRTLWLGAGNGSSQMSALQQRVEAALAKLGYRAEGRQFQPHLTIGRVRGGGPAMGELGRLVQQHADYQAGRTMVDQVVVFSSDLAPSGPTYEALSRTKLGG